MGCFETRSNRTSDYATVEDFRKIFSEDLDGLYQIAFLLTRDHEKAEQCFVSGLDDAVKTNNVFKDWARSWAKRALVKNAIRLVRPQPTTPGSSLPAVRNLRAFQTGSSEVNGVISLCDFERFVFVMSVLEFYSEQECALLLGCSFRDVRAARIQALQQIGNSLRTTSPVHETFQPQEIYR